MNSMYSILLSIRYMYRRRICPKFRIFRMEKPLNENIIFIGTIFFNQKRLANQSSRGRQIALWMPDVTALPMRDVGVGREDLIITLSSSREVEPQLITLSLEAENSPSNLGKVGCRKRKVTKEF